MFFGSITKLNIYYLAVDKYINKYVYLFSLLSCRVACSIPTMCIYHYLFSLKRIKEGKFRLFFSLSGYESLNCIRSDFDEGK